MRSRARSLTVLGLFAFGIAVGAEAAKANLQVTMLTQVNPQALALWDLTNDAQDDKGDIDARKIKPETWARLLEIGKSLEAAGRTLSTNERVLAAAPGAKLQDQDAPGSSKAADVQRYLDAKPAEFRKHATDLQRTGASIVAAVTRKDGKLLTEMSNSLDQVCEDCHMQFWYPQQAGAR